MVTNDILALLTGERDRINAAIAVLQGSSGTVAKRRGRPPKSQSPVSVATFPEKPARKKRSFTAAQRQAQARRMKAYWAKKRKAA